MNDTFDIMDDLTLVKKHSKRTCENCRHHIPFGLRNNDNGWKDCSLVNHPPQKLVRLDNKIPALWTGCEAFKGKIYIKKVKE